MSVVSIPIPVKPLISILISIPVCSILNNLIPVLIPKWLKISVIQELIPTIPESPIFVIDPTCEFAWKPDIGGSICLACHNILEIHEISVGTNKW